MKAFIAAACLLIISINAASAYEITFNLAFKVGSDKNDTIRINDTTYSGAGATAADFAGLSKKYISANRSSFLVLVFAGSSLSRIRLDTNYSSDAYLFQVKQLSEGNRVLIGASPGSWESVEDDLDELERREIIARNFAGIAFPQPANFLITFRLEYGNIDINNSLSWSGIGKLRIRNSGGVPPVVTIERV